MMAAAAAWPGASGPVQHSLAPMRTLAAGAGSGMPPAAQAGRPALAAIAPTPKAVAMRPSWRRE
jgi:hypothetical protein